MARKKCLFIAETLYQLFNAVIMRMNEHDGDSCDLVLGPQTAWRDSMLKTLRESGLFGSIALPNTRENELAFNLANVHEKTKIYRSPDLYFHNGVFADPDYDELYVPIDHLPWRMFFYYCRGRGYSPEVHMYDEGLRAYTMQIMACENAPYAQDAYGKGERFVDAIVSYHLHRPRLYAGGVVPFRLVQMPSPETNGACRQFLIEMYGAGKMPREKVVYLEDFFFADRNVTNDFYLFRTVADLVGKENIVVKRHPRDKFDRFAPFGYKEVPDSVVPWEVQLLAHDYTSKIFVSVTSTSLMTPFMIFDLPMHVISLENMFIGDNIAHKDKGFAGFMKAFRAMVNEKEVRWHSPRNAEELKEVLRALGAPIVCG